MNATKLLCLLVRPHLYLGSELSLGPGKIDLWHKLGECGSISAAARELGIQQENPEIPTIKQKNTSIKPVKGGNQRKVSIPKVAK